MASALPLLNVLLIKFSTPPDPLLMFTLSVSSSDSSGNRCIITEKTPTLNAINRSCDAQTATALINLFLPQLLLRELNHRQKVCFDVCALAQISYRFNQTKSAIVWRHTAVQIMPCIVIMEKIPTPSDCTIVVNCNRDIYPSVVCLCAQCTYQTHLIYC